MGVHDYRHGFARFRDGFRESGQGFTVWDTFLRDFVSRFVNYPIIVVLGHEFSRFRVPFRERSSQRHERIAASLSIREQKGLSGKQPGEPRCNTAY